MSNNDQSNNRGDNTLKDLFPSTDYFRWMYGGLTGYDWLPKTEMPVGFISGRAMGMTYSGARAVVEGSADSMGAPVDENIEFEFISLNEYLKERIPDRPFGARQESPCRGCGRPNDLGVKTCWCCGGADPTASK